MQLDHVIVAVRDLDAAVTRYTAILGRPVALRSDHPRGTRNALFLFERGPYLELLSLWDAPEQGTSAAALRRRLEERGEGLHGLALASPDIDAAVRRLRDQGLDIMAPMESSGTSPDGQVRRWRAARIPATAGDASYLVQHLDGAWRQLVPGSFSGRSSSAVIGVHHVAFDVPDAASASRRWEDWFGLPQTDAIVSERLGARVNVHRAGEATVEFVGATRSDGPVAARIARRGYGLSSLAFAVADLDAAVDAARRADVTIGDAETGVLPDSRVARLDPEDACGVAAQLLQFG